jgi:peroxiredoxin family protein
MVSFSEDKGVFTALVRKGSAAPTSLRKAGSKDTSSSCPRDGLGNCGLVNRHRLRLLGHQGAVVCTFWGLSILRTENPPRVRKGFLDRMFGAMIPRGPRRLALSRLHMMGAGTAMMKHVMRTKNVDSLPDMLARAMEMGVVFQACEMSMGVMGITREELLDGVETAGVGTFAALAEKSAATLFI